MQLARRIRRSSAAGAKRAQALVELALVMPILVGIVAVLFQFGILFIAYLAMVHETRDIGRYVAVHPDPIDGASCATVGSSWKQVCDNAPAVIDSTRVTPTFLPACAALATGRCTARVTGTQQKITLAYNASNLFFLPTTFRLGGFLTVAIPTTLPAYDYYVMVEPH
jgi:hypothetical protein